MTIAVDLDVKNQTKIIYQPKCMLWVPKRTKTNIKLIHKKIITILYIKNVLSELMSGLMYLYKNKVSKLTQNDIYAV